MLDILIRVLFSKFGLFSICSLFLVILTPSLVRRMTSVDGGYSEWSEWSQCLKACGNSIQGRVRNCSNPKPKGYGKDCLARGPYIETRPCQVKPCAIDGGFGPWSEWKECDRPCQDGKRKRSRDCNSPPPQYGGKSCDGSTEEEEQCHHLVPCPVDGGFSDWGPFSACSVTCGKGHKTRKRECNKPAPRYGGKNCDGSPEEVLGCEEKECEKKQ